MKVARGQLWSILNNSHERIEVRVVKVVRQSVHVAGTGRPFRSVLRRTSMERGYRGAKLVTAPDPWSLKNRLKSVRITEDERRSASELVKTTGPRGIAKAADGDEKVAALRAEGMTARDIAGRLGKTLSSVRSALNRIDNAAYDARMRAAMGLR